MYFSKVFSCLQVIFVEISAALFSNPGAHPYCLRIRIDCNSGAFQLAAFSFKRESTLQFKRICIINRDLNVLSYAVHKVLGADVEFIIINIDVSNMVYFQRIAFERIIIGFNQFPVLVIFCQSCGTAHPVIITFAAYALASVYLYRADQLILMYRQHDFRIGFRPLACRFLLHIFMGVAMNRIMEFIYDIMKQFKNVKGCVLISILLPDVIHNLFKFCLKLLKRLFRAIIHHVHRSVIIDNRLYLFADIGKRFEQFGACFLYSVCHHFVCLCGFNDESHYGI